MNPFKEIKSSLDFERFLGKFTEITTIDGKKCRGTIYTIDPISSCIIMVTQDENKLDYCLIYTRSVRSMEILGNSAIPDLDKLFTEDLSQVSRKDLDSRRIHLKNWLNKNAVPIVEDGEILRMGNVLAIHPPYGPNDCFCDRPIVFEKIHALMTSMPDDEL